MGERLYSNQELLDRESVMKVSLHYLDGRTFISFSEIVVRWGGKEDVWDSQFYECFTKSGVS